MLSGKVMGIKNTFIASQREEREEAVTTAFSKYSHHFSHS